MKKLMLTAIAIIFMVCLGSIALAATKDVTYTIPSVAVISLTDPLGPPEFIVPEAGQYSFSEIMVGMEIYISVNNK